MHGADMRAEEYGELQRLVDIFDLCDDLAEVVEALPSRTYTRQRLCDQLNSIVVGHGWGAVYGTVE